MNGVEVAMLVFAITLGTSIGARRLQTPLPVVLATVGIAAGLLWRFVPGLPPVRVPPTLVLLVFLPPLLTTAAYTLPWGVFRRNIRPIGSLAVGLVLATMLVTAAVAHAVAGLSWTMAFVLGAIIAPPDPVAATSVAGQTGLVPRLVVILEGEGLVNDAVAIIAYHLLLQTAAVAPLDWMHMAATALWEAPAGVAVGMAIGWGVMGPLRRRLDDVALEAGISLLVPYITYEIATRLGASAVLAVVTLGFVLQRQANALLTPAARVASRTMWSTVRFASTALVFLLLGLLIGQEASTGIAWSTLAAGGAITAAAIVLRFAWMYSVPTLLRLLGPGTLDAPPSRREATVLGWAGMRGVVSLALALALPAVTTSTGGDARHTVISITFLVIVGTLVLQGATLLPLITSLHAGNPSRKQWDERRVRARARRAGLAALDRVVRADASLAPLCAALAARVGDGTIGIAYVGGAGDRPRDVRPLLAALDAQRDVVAQMRDGGRIGEVLAERLVTEIDVDEMNLVGDADRLTGSLEERF